MYLVNGSRKKRAAVIISRSIIILVLCCGIIYGFTKMKVKFGDAVSAKQLVKLDGLSAILSCSTYLLSSTIIKNEVVFDSFPEELDSTNWALKIEGGDTKYRPMEIFVTLPETEVKQLPDTVKDSLQRNDHEESGQYTRKDTTMVLSVVDTAGKPLHNVQVKFRLGNPEIDIVETSDSNGLIELQVPCNPKPSRIRYLPKDGEEFYRIWCEPVTCYIERVPVIFLRYFEDLKLTIRLIDNRDNPVPNIPIRFWIKSFDWDSTVVSDMSGEIKLTISRKMIAYDDSCVSYLCYDIKTRRWSNYSDSLDSVAIWKERTFWNTGVWSVVLEKSYH